MRVLADCCEQAMIRDGDWPAAEVSAADRASLRRQVSERCLYGVDLNPTAVQLARVSLWLTTLAANRPLTFLDHHLAAGNSLLGARLSDLSRPPVSRGGREPSALPLFDDQLADDVSARVLPIRLRLAAPSESIEIVRDKERAMSALASWTGRSPDGRRRPTRGARRHCGLERRPRPASCTNGSPRLPAPRRHCPRTSCRRR
jgi:hypothetical protein